MPIPFFSSPKEPSMQVRFLSKEMLSFFEQYPYPVLLLDNKGKIVMANPAVAALLSCEPEQMLGTGVEQWGLSFNLVKKIAKQQTTEPHLYEVVTPTADTVLVNMTVTPLAQTKLLMITLDKQTQTPVGTSFLENCLQAYPMAVSLQDEYGKVILFNRYAEKMFSVTSKEAHGKVIYSFLPKELVSSLQRVDATISQTESCETVLLSRTNKQGEEIFLEITKTFVPAENGAENVIATVYRDVTKDRQEIRGLTQTKDTLNAILDHIPLGIYARDEKNNLMFYNKASAFVFDEPAQTVEHSHAFQELSQAKEIDEREQRILQEGKKCEFPEEEYTDAAGHKHILRLIKIPIKSTGITPLVLSVVEDVTHVRNQEREMRRVNSILSAIVHNMPIGLYARAENGELLLRNKQCESIFNVASVTLFDKTGTLPHETPEQIQSYMSREKQLLETRQTLDIPEEEYVTGEGKHKLLHLVKVPVVEEERRFVITLTEDITQRKKQEQEIIDSKNFLQAIINNLPVSLSVKDYDGNYILWNKKSEEIFGVPAEQVIGKKSYRSDLNADQMEFQREKELRVFESRKEQNIPQELISSAEEGVKIMHTVHTPVYHEDGTPDCLLTVSEDITAKTRMEKQIREANDKNNLLIDHAREAVLIVENKKVMYSNNAFLKLLGYSHMDEIKGRALDEFVDKDFRLFLHEKYEDALSENASHTNKKISLKLLTKNGHKIEVEFDAVAARYLGRRIVVCFCRDVTQDNRILRELREDKNTLKIVFEEGMVPAFRLKENGYISVMNKACRQLLGFTKEDKTFYCNVYIRPAFSLEIRRRLQKGESAEMDYVLDFDKAAEKFPSRINKTGKLPLHLLFVPINKRDTKTGVEADYVVYVLQKGVALPSVHNTTVQEQIMHVLEERSAQLNALLDATDGIVFSISLEKGKLGTVTHANKFLVEKLGMPAVELIQKKFERLFEDTAKKPTAPAFSKFEKELAKKGKVSFTWNMLVKEEKPFEAEVTVTALNLPQQETALVVVRDLSAKKHELVRSSEAALELTSIRRSLPGVYIKVSLDGTILDICSNLSYWGNDKAQSLIGKTAQDLWQEDMAGKVLSSVKEAITMNTSKKVDLSWKLEKKLRYFEMTVSPISGKAETVIWGVDVSSDRESGQQLHRVYRLLDDANVSLSEQVNKIMQFGVSAFHMEVGCILRFDEGKAGKESHVIYATENDQHLEEGMSFPTEECLQGVLEGNVVLWPELESCTCNACIHHKRGWTSLVAAPIYVGNEVRGALCFASTHMHAQFSSGAEELAGILARWLGLRIELKETGKMLNEASRSFARTLEYVEVPAVMMDLHYRMTFVNRPLLDFTGRHKDNMIGRNFFDEVVYDEKFALQRFEEACKKSSENMFKIHLELYKQNGLYEDKEWEVIVCKDEKGQVAGYGLIEASH